MDIVDSFVATLGLDPKQYNDEIKKYRQDRKRLDEEETKFNRTREDETKRMTVGIRQLRNETAGFLFMLAGANGVKDFAANLLTSDAATGRLAKNIGMATEQLSAWQEAVKRSGGTSGDADSALRTMSSAFQSYQLGQTTGHDADFQGLGVAASDLKNPETALLKIAEASQRMSRPIFTARLQRIGLNDATITLLSKGRKGVEDLLEEVRGLGVATDKSAEDAARFEASLTKIEQTIKAQARPAVEGFANVVSDFADDQKKVNIAMAVGVGVVGALAIGVGVAYAPFIALAGAIALVVTKIDDLKAAGRGFSEWWGGVKESTSSALDPIFDPLRTSWWGGMLGLKTGAEMRKDGGGGLPVDPRWAQTPDPTGPVTSAIGAGASRSGAGNSNRVEQYFRANGYTAAQARGMAAAMVAENGSLDPSAHNRAGGGQGAYGLGQWRGPRLAALRAKYGSNPTFDQQLQFMLEEMRGPERAAGAAIGAAGSSSAAARAMIDRFYRPGAGAAGDYRRAGRFLGQPGALATRGAAAGPVSNTTSIGEINVYTAAKDADGIANDMRGALAKRGLVVQANTGQQP